MKSNTEYILWNSGGYIGTWHQLDELLNWLQQERDRGVQLLSGQLTVEVVVKLRKEFYIEAL